MKSLGIISLIFVYIIAIFGAIYLITSGIKPIPTLVLFIVALLSFAAQLFLKKRLLEIDILILLFALLSSGAFALFITDIVFPPIAIAADCQGHKPSRLHYFDIIAFGLILTFTLGLIFIKKHTQKNNLDRVFSLVFIFVLILCFFRTGFFKNLKREIDNISTPTVVLPKDC